jgi:polyisoprenoid-binding protein YceI
MKRFALVLALLFSIVGAYSEARADVEEYVIDTKKAHAFIEFKISHLGFSWMLGRFNTFEGAFVFDGASPEKSSVSVKIDPASIDTNHAERDKHLRGKDFLDVEKYPEASFVSTSIKRTGENTAIIKGNFTLHGVTREIAIDAKHVGAGKDPWGGYRRGFEGRVKFALKDFGMDYDLGPASREVEIFMSFEGIKKQ